jgi:hypothetical protein
VEFEAGLRGEGSSEETSCLGSPVGCKDAALGRGSRSRVIPTIHEFDGYRGSHNEGTSG